MAESAIYKNKKRVLISSSRAIGPREKHLLEDLLVLLPHSKKESKLSAKANLTEMNELCELRSSGSALFIERRRDHNNLWLSKVPKGPSVKFRLQNGDDFLCYFL